MDNLIDLLIKIKTDNYFHQNYNDITLEQIEIFSNLYDINDTIHLITYLYLEGVDFLHTKEPEMIKHIVDETRKGNFEYLYTISKTRKASFYLCNMDRTRDFIKKLCDQLIPQYLYIYNHMLKQLVIIDAFNNMILPLIVTTIQNNLIICNLENRLNDLENIIYYSPGFGTEYNNAKDRFEQMSLN
jgi:hypothetical protein